MRKYFFSLFLFFILFNEVQSQISTCETNGVVGNDCLNIIDTAVPLLNAKADAISGGMGEAGIALSSKTNAVLYNSAKMVFNDDQGGISLSFSPWLRNLGITDIYLANLTGFYKIDDFQAVGGSIRYFSFGEITFTDFTGLSLMQYKPKEMYIDFAYSAKLNDQFGIGANIKYIHSDLAEGIVQFSPSGTTEEFGIGRAIAVDLSAFYRQILDLGEIDGNLNVGITFSNIGNKISYFKSKVDKGFLPTNLGIGLAYTLNFNNGSKITVAYDMNKLLVPTPQLDGSHLNKNVLDGVFSSFTDAPLEVELAEINHSVGIEGFIRFFNGFYIIRAGYFNEHRTKGNRKYFTLGTGYQFKPFEISFSRIIDNKYHPLNNTYKVSLQYYL